MPPRGTALETTTARKRPLVNALAIGALLAAFALAFGAPSASAHAKTNWCGAQQLSLTNAAGAHTHQNSTSASFWTLQLRNHSRSACLVGGTLRFASVRAKIGTHIAAKVRYNLDAFGAAAKTFVLKPGARAFAQMADPIALSPQTGCTTPARLTFDLPHNAGRLSVLTPDTKAEQYSVCPNLALAVSPTYSAKAFNAYRLTLITSPGHVPYVRRAHDASGQATQTPPPVCDPTSLTLTPATTGAAAGTTVAVTVTTSGPACLLLGAAPTLTFDGGSAGPVVAKLYVVGQVSSLTNSAVTSFAPAGAPNSVGAEVAAGTPVQLAFILPAGTSTTPCTTATSVTLYPGGAANDPGTSATLAGPVNVCGSPRELPYQAASTNATALGAAALKTMTTALTTASIANDGTGYNYGTDSSSSGAPCGSLPYTEPINTCSNGTDGKYGFYSGIDGAWDSWQGCSTGWVNFNSTAYGAAEANLVDDSIGGGGSILWLGAGDGRNPNYDSGSVSEADTWGTEQAERINSDAENNSLFSDLTTIWMDMEAAYNYNGSGGNDYNGWNAIWSSACGGSSSGAVPAAGLNWDVFDSFRNYIANDTYYMPGVYSAGGSSGYGPSTWAHIIGGNTLSNTLTWTFDTQDGSAATSSSVFPTSFSGSGFSASWFAGAPSQCQAAWQWDTAGAADLDQVYASRLVGGSCA